MSVPVFEKRVYGNKTYIMLKIDGAVTDASLFGLPTMVIEYNGDEANPYYKISKLVEQDMQTPTTTEEAAIKKVCDLLISDWASQI
jgi:hypothetical protein